VAIKVVEHAPVFGDEKSLEEQQVEREALLACSLAHPNIIATCVRRSIKTRCARHDKWNGRKDMDAKISIFAKWKHAEEVVWYGCWLYVS
jgi:hypothetical protein